MNYNTVYVGMDVHKESFTFCAYTIDAEKSSHFQRTEADYKNVLKYLEFLRTVYGNDANFICGYEAGCLGYTLYHQLTEHHVNCVILAPTTMLEQCSRRRIKRRRRAHTGAYQNQRSVAGKSAQTKTDPNRCGV
mgnify:CR=1 FL=1